MFSVGQLVVCVYDFRGDPVMTLKYPGQNLPEKSRVYTVRSVELRSHPSSTFQQPDGSWTVIFTGQREVVLLEEVRNEPHPWADGVLELSFTSLAFKPVQSIEALEEMLLREPVDA